MCEHDEEILDKLDNLTDRLRHLDDRLSHLERKQKHIDSQLLQLDMQDFSDAIRTIKSMNGDQVSSLSDSVKELNLIVHGNERLGVPPLRTQVKELYTFYDRAKWAGGALGITNFGIIITYLISLFSNNT